VLPLCRELLPPLAGVGEPGSNELLASVYELILLHVGRGTLGSVSTSPAIGELLRVTFPRLRPLLLARPKDLPAALSNAVENLGGRGVELARGLGDFANLVTDGDELLNAGAVLAWRLGEARLRTTALAKVRQLTPPVAKLALGIGAWPDRAVDLVVAGLEADGWRRPDEMLSPQTLGDLPRQSPEQYAALTPRLSAPPAESKTEWRLAGRLGNFRGFDGHFDQPPLLLDSGSQGNRHRFWVRSGTTQHRLDGDVFGWVCRPDSSVDFPVAADKATRKRLQTLPATATSWVESETLIAFTLADSFRIRLLTPDRRPL